MQYHSSPSQPINMHRRVKRICFNFLGKLALLGITACILLAFLGPCLYSEVNDLNEQSQEKIARGVASSSQPDVNMRPEKGKRTIHDLREPPDDKPAAKPKSFNKGLQRNSNISVFKNKLKDLSEQILTKNFSKHSRKAKDKLKATSSLSLESVRTNKTSWNERIQLDDIFIGVKTGNVYHKKRLDLLLETWVMQAKDQTFFFTDREDEEYQRKSNGHLINTGCASDHSRKALCCKMGFIFDTFMKQGKRWFCHLDDDNYLNTKELVSYLQKYNPEKDDIYVGKTQLRRPIETKDKQRPGQTFRFYFATGGAGFCISKSLAIKMVPHASNGGFNNICERIRWPDDMAVGYIVEALLNKSLIVEKRFNSHIQALGNIRPEELTKQITLSYMFSPVKKFFSAMHLPKGVFNTTVDPTRFKSLHCMLYPNTNYCPKG